MIFKQGSCEEELSEGMQAKLEAVAEDDVRREKLILEAMQELQAAAEIFEKAGRIVRAREITQIMESLAEDEDEKKVSSNEENDDEIKKMFMFFGFGPGDLAQGFSFDGDDGDGD